nr:odorant receptor 8 [Diaphania glauculalis]
MAIRNIDRNIINRLNTSLSKETTQKNDSLLDESLLKLKFAFQLTGLNIENKKRSPKQNFIYFFNLLWVITDLISSLFWTVDGIRSGKNFTDLTYLAPCIFFTVLSMVKTMYLLSNEPEMYALIENLRKLERRAYTQGNFGQDEITKPDITFLNRVIKVLNVFNCLMIVVFDLSPILIIGVRYYRTGELKLMLPILDIYPFDAFNLKYWPFAYIHQIWSESVCLLDICASDYFFFICCTHIRIQFRLIQHHFQETISVKSISAVDTIDHADVRAKFRDLVIWHQEIIRSANMLEGVYSKSNLFNFTASSLIICLAGFNVTTIDNKAFVMTFIIFLFMGMLQVFFLCLFGDILMSSSNDVSTSVYNSRWYLCDVKIGRDVLLVQKRSQNPCKVTAAGFADVNLKAFMKILSSAWSYFALLQTVYGSRS